MTMVDMDDNSLQANSQAHSAAAGVWTTKLRTQPQRDSNADGLVIKP